MNPIRKQEIRDFKSEIIKKKNQYIVNAMKFRLRILKEREIASNLRKKKQGTLT